MTLDESELRKLVGAPSLVVLMLHARPLRHGFESRQPFMQRIVMRGDGIAGKFFAD